MQQLIGDFTRHAVFYLKDVIGWSNVVIVAALATSVPALNAGTGGRLKWTRAGVVLSSYIIGMIVAILALFALGVFLQAKAPEVFDSWRESLNAGSGGDVVVFLPRLIAALPVAFGVSSLVYGLFGGPSRFILGLLGVVAAIALAAFAVIGIIFAGCIGWSSCP